MDSAAIILPDGPIFARHGGWVTNKRRKTRQTDSVSIPYPPGTVEQLPIFTHVIDKETPEASELPEVLPELKSKPQSFLFVDQSSRGAERDQKIRSEIYRHVRRNGSKKTKKVKDEWKKTRDDTPQALVSTKKLPAQTLSDYPAAVSSRVEISSPSMSSVSKTTISLLSPSPPIGLSTALTNYTWPIDMSNRTHTLLNRYLTHMTPRLFPLHRILGSSTSIIPPAFSGTPWFHYAITDPALLHGMLYAGAVYLHLLSSSTSTTLQPSRDMLFHSTSAISIIRQRLQSDLKSSDNSTLGALSCLALGESMTGNTELWNTHMGGLKSLIGMRRKRQGHQMDLEGLPDILETKLRRADVYGALSTLAVPRLAYKPSLHMPAWSMLPLDTVEGVHEKLGPILESAGIHQAVIEPVVELALLIETQHYIRWNSAPGMSGLSSLDSRAFDETTYRIFHHLLSVRSYRGEEQLNGLSNVMRIAALMYLKAFLDEWPKSSWVDQSLVERLKESVGNVIEENRNESQAEVMTWILGLGALYEEGERRSWWLERSRVVHSKKDTTQMLDLGGCLSLKSVFSVARIEQIIMTGDARKRDYIE